jgi:hypothetical protein
LAHSTPLYANLKTLTVHGIHRLQKAIFMYKFVNNLLPYYFRKRNSIHSHGTRASQTFRPPNFRTDLARNSIRREGPLEWNDISNKIKSSNSVHYFSNKYKDYLLSFYI